MALRTAAGFLISLAAVLILMPVWIEYLKKISFNQTVSVYSLHAYKEKASTPIMGGVLFIVIPIIVTLLLSGSYVKNIDLIIVMLSFFGYGLIGFIDDYLIVVKHSNDGLMPKQKLFMQIVFAIILYFLYRSDVSSVISIPFTGCSLNFGFAYILLFVFMFTGSSNAVNLTDGMDGLAAGCMVFSLIPFLIFSAQQGRIGISIFVSSLIGALIGYLRFNIKPARIFMGDTGSLSLGAVLAALAIVLKKELPLVLIGGVFVLETLCVLIQLGSIKLRGKRVFPYTPIHYAFVMGGRSENQVVHLFWIIASILSIAGFFAGLHM